MSLNSIIHRKLSWGGCRFVGTQLADRIKALSEKNVSLTPDVTAAIEKVAAVTADLSQLSGHQPSPRRVDNSADQFIATYHRIFEIRETCYLASDVLPLSNEDKQQLDLLQKVRLTLFPKGVAWVTENFIEQWNRMFEIKETLKEPNTRQDILQLGLTAETSRFLHWIDRYEQAIKPGASPADKAAQLIHAFHTAWEEFTIEVRHAYKSNPELRQTLLEAFDTQLAREQDADRVARQRTETNATQNTTTQHNAIVSDEPAV